MQTIIEKWKKVWSKEYAISLLASVLIFIFSIVINYYSAVYASERTSYAVTDIILSNFHVIDIDGLIVYTSLALILFTAALLISQPKRLPFVGKTIGLFIIIRAIFVSLTHVGPFSPQLQIGPNLIASLVGLAHGGDLFFSGHTGMPFIAALMVWQEKPLRYLYLSASILLGAGVLFAHLHYSIDVFAAFFITYTIFTIAKKLFAKDWQLFESP